MKWRAYRLGASTTCGTPFIFLQIFLCPFQCFLPHDLLQYIVVVQPPWHLYGSESKTSPQCVQFAAALRPPPAAAAAPPRRRTPWTSPWLFSPPSSVASLVGISITSMSTAAKDVIPPSVDRNEWRAINLVFSLGSSIPEHVQSSSSKLSSTANDDVKNVSASPNGSWRVSLRNANAAEARSWVSKMESMWRRSSWCRHDSASAMAEHFSSWLGCFVLISWMVAPVRREGETRQRPQCRKGKVERRRRRPRRNRLGKQQNGEGGGRVETGWVTQQNGEA